MAPISIIFGVVLIALGAIGFALADPKSATALIPGAFGAVIAVLGVVAMQEKHRKHAMHGAVLVGFLGFVGGTVMPVLTAIRGKVDERPLAFGMQIAMAVTCAIFVALCIKSFIDARRRRQQSAGQ